VQWLWRELTSMRSGPRSNGSGSAMSLASEYHHALKNGSRPVGRPKKPKPPCARCEVVDSLVREWSAKSSDFAEGHGRESSFFAELRDTLTRFDGCPSDAAQNDATAVSARSVTRPRCRRRALQDLRRSHHLGHSSGK
jgi:hypothetical protein